MTELIRTSGPRGREAFFSPWQIGTLKYLEIEIKKWPSGARRGKRVQIGPIGTYRTNWTKWGQMGLNGIKQN